MHWHCLELTFRIGSVKRPPDDLREDYQQLLQTLTDLETKLDQMPDLSQIEVAVLRCLVVHNWRRLVLRHPPLPQALLPEDWPGHACHRMVASLLDRFPRPDLSRIAQQAAAA
ncbi:PaaX family transcriptional regulator C-terminal domain-containing protein [Sulfitobacter sp. M368]|uniref:PaaX family transcriptional regulator C-terminal domain-containing protein n=1 Tax=Sulfitobacter sp. M368 TaxID=2867021 RepID=UPI0021A4AD1D|nr:PaaX family transcriptional regulator C-terminal domain-containing protein [Sulfitobacter sp. M368]